MKTRNNIYYILSASPFTETVSGATFYFSSKAHLLKFRKRLEAARIRIGESLSGRFGFTVDPRPIAEVWLYCQIERRGFYITFEDGRVAEWLRDLESSGARLTKKSSTESSATSTPRSTGS